MGNHFIFLKYVRTTFMKHLQTVALITLGNLLCAFAINTFIIHNKFIIGGVTGTSIIFNHLFGLPISTIIYIVNAILFVLGLLFLGKRFALSTLLSSIMLPFFLGIFEQMSWQNELMLDSFLSCVLGGILTGIGNGLIIRQNASTGGYDTLALILKKAYKVPVHITVYVIDTCLILAMLTFSNLTNLVYGLITTFLLSYAMNKVLTSGNSQLQIFIISSHYEEIRRNLLYDLDVGVTLLHSQTGFHKKELEVLITIIPNIKLQSLKKIVKDIDPTAFISVAEVSEIGGRGYTLERKTVIASELID